MSGKQFYADKIYKDEQGHFYTEMAMRHCGYKDESKMTLVADPYTECRGKWVRCEYSQIFYPDSSLLLCNSIVEYDEELEENLESGDPYIYYDADGNEVTAEDDFVEQAYPDIYQFYLMDEGTAQRLREHTEEIIFRSRKLDLPVLAVTHWGTGWDYVETDFKY